MGKKVPSTIPKLPSRKSRLSSRELASRTHACQKTSEKAKMNSTNSSKALMPWSNTETSMAQCTCLKKKLERPASTSTMKLSRKDSTKPSNPESTLLKTQKSEPHWNTPSTDPHGTAAGTIKCEYSY